MKVSPSATKWLTSAPVIIGILIGAGAVMIVMTIISAAGIFNPLASPIPQTEYPSIEIEMSKTDYQVGERLDFAIHTYGICATPDVTIWRFEGDEWVMVFQYMATPFSCPSTAEPGQPHTIWKAEQLVQRISDENFGGNGDSVLATSGAINLKKVGNYTVSASLIDRSRSVSTDFTVVQPDQWTLTSDGVTLGAPYLAQISWDLYETIYGNSNDLSISIKDKETMEPLKQVTYDFMYKGLSELGGFQERFVDDFSNPDKFRTGIRNPCEMHLTIFVDKVGDQSFANKDFDTSSVLIQFRTSPANESQGCDNNNIKLSLFNGYDLEGNRVPSES